MFCTFHTVLLLHIPEAADKLIIQEEVFIVRNTETAMVDAIRPLITSSWFNSSNLATAGQNKLYTFKVTNLDLSAFCTSSCTGIANMLNDCQAQVPCAVRRESAKRKQIINTGKIHRGLAVHLYGHVTETMMKDSADKLQRFIESL